MNTINLSESLHKMLDEYKQRVIAVNRSELYTDHPFPKKEHWGGETARVDAFLSIQGHIGHGAWDKFLQVLKNPVYADSKKELDEGRYPCPVCFEDELGFYGIKGFLCEVIYDHIHGEGIYAARYEKKLAEHFEAAAETGFAFGQNLHSNPFTAMALLDPNSYQGNLICLDSFIDSVKNGYDAATKPKN